MLWSSTTATPSTRGRIGPRAGRTCPQLVVLATTEKAWYRRRTLVALRRCSARLDRDGCCSGARRFVNGRGRKADFALAPTRRDRRSRPSVDGSLCVGVGRGPCAVAGPAQLASVSINVSLARRWRARRIDGSHFRAASLGRMPARSRRHDCWLGFGFAGGCSPKPSKGFPATHREVVVDRSL